MISQRHSHECNPAWQNRTNTLLVRESHDHSRSVHNHKNKISSARKAELSIRYAIAASDDDEDEQVDPVNLGKRDKHNRRDSTLDNTTRVSKSRRSRLFKRKRIASSDESSDDQLDVSRCLPAKRYAQSIQSHTDKTDEPENCLQTQHTYEAMSKQKQSAHRFYLRQGDPAKWSLVWIILVGWDAGTDWVR
jgi:hypothetical protein